MPTRPIGMPDPTPSLRAAQKYGVSFNWPNLHTLTLPKTCVITAAGLILAGTFAVLTALPLLILLEFGTVVAIGVLVDTFIVRSMLVPSITVLLGDRAFWPRRPAKVLDPS